MSYGTQYLILISFFFFKLDKKWNCLVIGSIALYIYHFLVSNDTNFFFFFMQKADIL